MRFYAIGDIARLLDGAAYLLAFLMIESADAATCPGKGFRALRAGVKAFYRALVRADRSDGRGPF